MILQSKANKKPKYLKVYAKLNPDTPTDLRLYITEDCRTIEGKYSDGLLTPDEEWLTDTLMDYDLIIISPNLISMQDQNQLIVEAEHLVEYLKTSLFEI